MDLIRRNLKRISIGKKGLGRLSRNPAALDLIIKQQIPIDWDELCSNPNPKAIDIIRDNWDRVKHKLNWNALSKNPAATGLLLEYPEKINRAMLSYNPHPDAVAMLKENPEMIVWTCLSTNPSALELLEENIENVSMKHLCCNPRATKMLETYSPAPSTKINAYSRNYWDPYRHACVVDKSQYIFTRRVEYTPAEKIQMTNEQCYNLLLDAHMYIQVLNDFESYSQELKYKFQCRDTTELSSVLKKLGGTHYEEFLLKSSVRNTIAHAGSFQTLQKKAEIVRMKIGDTRPVFRNDLAVDDLKELVVSFEAVLAIMYYEEIHRLVMIVVDEHDISGVDKRLRQNPYELLVPYIGFENQGSELYNRLRSIRNKAAHGRYNIGDCIDSIGAMNSADQVYAYVLDKVKGQATLLLQCHTLSNANPQPAASVVPARIMKPMCKTRPSRFGKCCLAN